MDPSIPVAFRNMALRLWPEPVTFYLPINEHMDIIPINLCPGI